MPSVDDRIVRMEFDNASFERKLGTTLTSLDKLEKSLKFEGAGKGLQNISTQAGKTNLSSLASSVSGIADKFKSLSVIGVTALATIASKAVTAGVGIAKSLSLDLVIGGFKEYETNIGSIQTILANTKDQGTNLKDVNDALDQLNQYSDKTIYNFGQMAKNIGTFTAAGVDLDTSVQSIKGISNLAAISGSSSEQASNAMYQLSQAIATGSVKLQDWNSIVNAGMGGEVFQKALFESGKALKTIKGVPIGQTFEEWTDAGNSFRGSLTKGWVTSEVLTTTLQGFTGEMTEAQLEAKGFTKEQAKAIVELGKTGVDAATQVRTLSGLIQTTKEAIGSGWSASFRIVFGNFKEATKLFSDISSAVGDMISKSADARNELLQGWKDLGGRTLFIESLRKTIKNLGRILKPIKDAFKEIFPPATSKSLFRLTQSFAQFAKALRPSKDTVDALRRIFKGFFSALDLGWEVLKQGAKFIKFLFDSMTGGDAGNFLDFAARIGDFFTDLNDRLVEGKGLKRFFKNLRRDFKEILPIIQVVKNKVVNFFTGLVEAIKDPVKFFKYVKEKLRGAFQGLFDGFDVKLPGVVGVAFERLQQRFETLKTIISKIRDIWRPFKTGFDKVIDVLDRAWEAIKNWFSELKDKLAAVMKPGDFDAVVDAVNVGLVGGILGVLATFLKRGIKLDIGEGLLRNIGKSFEQLTGIMKAMQADIKASALLKIATAIAILTASVLVLSLIDSAALTKALTAMAVGFGQLLGAFAIISKLSAGPKGAASFGAIAAGMILLSGAILVLSVAVRILSGLSWEELGKGLLGVAVLLGVITAAVNLMPQKRLISTGIGLMGVAVAMNILAGAVKIFSLMSLEEMGRGFVGVAGGLVAIALGMRLMPSGLALQSVGLLLVATSLNILAGAVKLFSMMDWEEMGKGMVGIAGSLLIIGLAMKLMPPTMPLIGAGLILVSIGLLAISQALQQMGGMSWGEIAKGLVAMAGSLLILAIAAKAMESSLLGFVAMTIGGAALLILANALQAFAGLSWGDLLKGLVGIAAVIAVLAVSAMLIQPAIPALVLLGAALLAIGAGFALFGFGANLVAQAFETLSKVGKKGAETLIASLEAIGKALPALIKGFAEGLVELIQVFVDAAPVIAKGLIVLLEHILDGLGKLIPKAVELIAELITTLLDYIKTVYPKFVETGISLITSLLEGIRNNIGKIVHLVGEIITEFLDAFTAEIPRIVKSLQELIRTIFTEVVIGLNPATLLFLVGSDILSGLWDGIKGKLEWLKDKVFGFFGKIIDWVKNVFGIGSPAKKMIRVGKDIILGIVNGIKDNIFRLINWAKGLAGKVLGWIGNLARTLWNKGTDLFKGLWGGIWERMQAVITWYKNLGKSILTWIGDLAQTLWKKGRNLIAGFWGGIWERMQAVITWLKDVSWKILTWIGDLGETLLQKGKDLIQGFWDGIQALWDGVLGVATWLKNLGAKAVSAVGNLLETLVQAGKDLIQGFWDGIQEIWDDVWEWIKDKIDLVPGFLKSALGLDSPSKITREMGRQFMEGFAVGFEEDKTFDRAQANLANNINGFKRSLSSAVENLGTTEEFNPVITPVLDLTSVQADAKKMNGYIQSTQKITPVLSFKQAQLIAAGTRSQPEETAESVTARGEVKFEQNIFAPKQLSTNDIYKQTRNQITMAKEELSIR